MSRSSTAAAAADRVAGFRAVARQLSTFGAVSVATTILDFGLFNVLILGNSVPVLAANTISYSAGIVASYLLNKRFTFAGGGREKRSQEVALFLVFNILGLGLNNLAVALVADVRSTLLLNAMKLVAGVVAALVKFVGFRRWVYPMVAGIVAEEESS